jgi:hypothetical protein
MSTRTRRRWSAAGAVTAAGTAAATIFCCLPFASDIVGASVAAAGARFAPFQSYVAAVSVLFLGYAFYQAYRPGAAQCDDGLCDMPAALRRRRLVLWAYLFYDTEARWDDFPMALRQWGRTIVAARDTLRKDFERLFGAVHNGKRSGTMNGRSACPTTWKSSLYWAIAFAVVALILVATAGTLWTAGRHSNEVAFVLAAAMACFANYRRHCTFHCRLTGPLFLIAATSLILDGHGVGLIPEWLVWTFTAAGTIAAFWLEARYARRPSAEGCDV